MSKIAKIDEDLTECLKEFSEVAANLNFEVAGDVRDEELIQEHKYPGVYLIEIECSGNDLDFSTWLDDFRNNWEDPTYKKKWTPNIKKKRIEKHHVLKNWMPLYIGKSKNVSKRVLEHLNLRLEQPTTGLKLKARTNMNSSNFRFSTIKVDVVNYDIIMPMTEKALRERINPILGRQ